MTQPARWICAQLGSREHYAIPRVLHSDGRLEYLLTDFWAAPRWLWKAAPGRRFAAARERWHAELMDARVHSLGLTRLFFDASNRRPGWETTIRRNDWFQRRHLAWLRKDAARLASGAPGIFFAYSYAARDLLRFFKDIGWKTVLGQIDPGPREEAIVAAEADRYPAWRGKWTPAPAGYWKAWREELDLADRVVVNSEWSLDCLRLEGVAQGKMSVIPLAYEQGSDRRAPKVFPARFTRERPLRVLFLGQVNLRKGAHQLLKAAERMRTEPIEFVFVGPVEVSLPGASPPNVIWHGPVSRDDTARFYANADVFALPTLSDGFALTQLEALSHGVPVIATSTCARVVEDGHNGWILPTPSVDDIIAVLECLIASPDEVSRCASHAYVSPAYSMHALRDALLAIETELR